MIDAVVLGGLALCVLTVVAVVKRLVVDEVTGWIAPLCQRIIRAAAGRLPAQKRQRYEEEWLAELAALRDRRLSGVWLALSLLRGARAMGSALEESVALSGSPPDDAAIPTKLRPDLDQIAEVIHRIVEKSRGAERTWSRFLEEMRVTLREVEIDDDELDHIGDAFADLLESTRECEPYREWHGQPAAVEKRRLLEQRAMEAEREAERDAAREAARTAELRSQRRWSGLSGPDWWRRR